MQKGHVIAELKQKICYKMLDHESILFNQMKKSFSVLRAHFISLINHLSFKVL